MSHEKKVEENKYWVTRTIILDHIKINECGEWFLNFFVCLLKGFTFNKIKRHRCSNISLRLRINGNCCTCERIKFPFYDTWLLFATFLFILYYLCVLYTELKGSNVFWLYELVMKIHFNIKDMNGVHVWFLYITFECVC